MWYNIFDSGYETYANDLSEWLDENCTTSEVSVEVQFLKGVGICLLSNPMHGMKQHTCTYMQRRNTLFREEAELFMYLNF